MKIESIEFIPMKPDGETIFDEEYIEHENFMYTTDFEEWVEHSNKMTAVLIKMNEESKNTNYYLIPVDEDIKMEFAKRFSHYQTSPICKRGVNTIVAKSYRVQNLDEFDTTNKVLYDVVKYAKKDGYRVKCGEIND